MRRLRFFRTLAVILACTTWGFPGPMARAAESLQETSIENSNTIKPFIKVFDIELGVSDSLSGQVVNAQGVPIAKSLVEIRQIGGEPATTVTNNKGFFEFSEIRGGVYYVTSAGTSQACRCWSPKTAPPSAKRQLMLVAQSDLQRGQQPFGDYLLADPLLIGLFIAAGVAIPVAIHNSKGHRPPGS